MSSASEIFHGMIRQIIQDIPGAKNISDDLVVYGTNLEQHDSALHKVLKRLLDCGLSLYRKKCEFRTNRISFLGVVFSDSGISPDPEKVKAIKEFGKPQNVKDLRSFLGMINYSSSFIKDYAEICQLSENLPTRTSHGTGILVVKRHSTTLTVCVVMTS
jgi:hypothetical protein